MCKGRSEPGGPRRCSSDTRQRLHASHTEVGHLEQLAARLRGAVDVVDSGGDAGGEGKGAGTQVDWSAVAQRPLSYSAVGATSGDLPDGYHHIRRHAVIGSGRSVYEQAAGQLMNWGVQRGAGLRVEASTGAVQAGSLVKVGIGPLSALCRVVYVVSDANCTGFAYGTLEGHPESGEERFTVSYDPGTEDVRMDVVAFSRPATWWSRAGSRVTSAVQEQITQRYLRALRSENPFR